MSQKRDAACSYKRLAHEGLTSVHEDRDGGLVVCEGGRVVRRVGVVEPGLGRARGRRRAKSTDKLVSAREAAARVLAVNPNATLKTLPPWIFPFADYMRESSPVAKGRITERDVIKAYLLTKSSVQRGAIGVPKVCKTFPGFRPRERDAKKVRPEDAMAELLLSPVGKAFLDDAERGVFNREAAEQIADSFACFGLVYPKAGADLSDPIVVRKTKDLFLADLARAPRLAAQADAWCLAQRKRAKTFSRDAETGELRQGVAHKVVRQECFGTEGQAKAAVARRCARTPRGKKCAWTTIKPITSALTDPNPKAYYEWAQEYLPGIAAAKVGFFAALLGRGDIPTFDAREINLWFPKGKGAPKWRDVEELREKIDDFPMALRPGDEPARAHLVHHALWDQFSPNPTTTTHEELVEAMQLAGPKRRKKQKKPKRRDAVAVAAHVAQRQRGGAHTDKRDRRGKHKRAWREEEF